MTTDETRKVAELLEDERIGMVTTTPPEGTLGWRRTRRCGSPDGRAALSR
jgi:hypothetical protein